MMEQRTKDLSGLIGQVRGFNLDEFLSDWEPQGEALPWTVGDKAWVGEAAAAMSPYSCAASGETAAAMSPYSCAVNGPYWTQIMASEGLGPSLKVLYVPDYLTLEQRIATQAQLLERISRLLPQYVVHLAVADGPFEDDDGASSHFTKNSLNAPTHAKQIGNLRVDLHTSVVKLARHAALHMPKLIFGRGQGAIVAAVFGHAGCLEQVLSSRNVQPCELHEIGQAWGNVSGIFIHELLHFIFIES